MAIPTGYSLAAGWNAADGSLVLVSEILRAYTVPYMGVTIEPHAGLENPFPVRTQALNGRERGDGMVLLTWAFAAMPIAAYRYWSNTYFTNGTLVSVPVTLGTARYDVNAIWVKYNANMILPSQGVDYIYDSQFVLNLNLRFSDLIAI